MAPSNIGYPSTMHQVSYKVPAPTAYELNIAKLKAKKQKSILKQKETFKKLKLKRKK